MLIDHFAVSNVANAGANMTLESGTNQRIVSQAVQGNATGTTAGWYRYNARKVNGDNMMVSSGLITPNNGTLNNTGLGQALFVRMPDTFSTSGAAGRYACLFFYGSGRATIYSAQGTTLTSRFDQTTSTITLPGILKFYAINDFYIGFWNDVEVARWQDTSNTVITIGSTKRNVGGLMQCLATNQQSPSWDWYAAHDSCGMM